jgi:hypothetical protein
MPIYKVKPGHKVVVADPANPGRTLDKLEGDTLTLGFDDAEPLLGSLDLVEPEQAAPQADLDAEHH